MNEEILNEEQPENTCSVSVAAASKENGNNESIEGSLYGKFKDAGSLYSSYVELEKEFTKKSQLLSELQKSINDNAEKVPFYKTEDWQSEVDKYMKDKPYADAFAKEVAKTLMQDENLAKEANCLDLAYNKVLANHYKSVEEIAKDNNFLNNYIFNNEEVKSKILNEYLSGLKHNTTPPLVLNTKGESVGLISPTKPKNLSEARKLVEQLFN